MVVKMSSLGDIIHTLPALTDAVSAIPGVRFDWLVEEAFAEIPAWHPAVDRVIPVALRRWRRRPWRCFAGPEWRAVARAAGGLQYDAVIDAQGLLKSAWIMCRTRGPRYGMDWRSLREPLACAVYQQRLAVPRDLHAVERLRRLFAQALHYPLPASAQDYGLQGPGLQGPGLQWPGLQGPDLRGLCLHDHGSLAAGYPGPGQPSSAALVCLHGTSRKAKCWPESSWQELIGLAVSAGRPVMLPWGNALELARAQRLAACFPSSAVRVLPRLTLTDMALCLRKAHAAVAVDTGLGHLCAALDVPTVSLYGPTRPSLIGTRGASQVHLSPEEGSAMQRIYPADVWHALGELRSRS